MKKAMIAVVGLALLLGATTAQAQDNDSKFWIGAGLGTRMVTGDTPAPRIGETANLLQFGVHGLWGFNPLFGVVVDWAYGFRELSYESSASVGDSSQTSIDNISKSRGWSLNALFAFRLPVGSRGGQLYAGPGLALINQEFRVEQTVDGVVSVTDAKLGTNVGLAIGAGAIMPISRSWHAFFSLRNTWALGTYDQNTTNSKLKAEIPIGGPAVLVGAGYNF